MKRTKRPLLHTLSLAMLLAMMWGGCVLKEPIEFKGIKNVAVDVGIDGKPVLKADVFFFNPNKTKMKLREVNVEVFVDDVKSADVNHSLDVVVPQQSDFSVSVIAQLSMKQNLLETMFSLLGGKKYKIAFKGYIRVRVHGLTIKVPVAQSQEVKLNI
jgi:LEA14-like dessication related protein